MFYHEVDHFDGRKSRYQYVNFLYHPRDLEIAKTQYLLGEQLL